VTVAGVYDEPKASPLGIILSPEWLITVHFDPLRVLAATIERFRSVDPRPSSIEGFLQLLEGSIEVEADQIERALAELDALSFRIYHHEKVKLTRLDAQLRATLQQLGRTSQRVNKLRDVLLVLGRSLPFLRANAPWIPETYDARITTLRTDITWLDDQVGHALRQIQFLQEATIGFIGIEQSHIIKVLAVVSTVGVPPTLFASIWGMNFEHMPELKLAFAYPVALSVIVMSAIIPLAWFRRAGWL
jgi:magnesium transporter